MDPRDDKSYPISLDVALVPTSQRLHEADHVRNTTRFDGGRYAATSIAIDEPVTNSACPAFPASGGALINSADTRSSLLGGLTF